MKSLFDHLFTSVFIALLSCGNSNAEKKATEQPVAKKASALSIDNIQDNGIVGEWQQQYTCFDKNGNYQLDTEEKKPSNTQLGFDWFNFNADGSCLRDNDVKFKGTYSIQEKSGTKKLVIEGSDHLRYTIIELNDKELILGADGSFIVFKKIK